MHVSFLADSDLASLTKWAKEATCVEYTFESGLAEKTLSAYAADIRRYLVFLESQGIDSCEKIRREHLLDHLIAFSGQFAV